MRGEYLILAIRLQGVMKRSRALPLKMLIGGLAEEAVRILIATPANSFLNCKLGSYNSYKRTSGLLGRATCGLDPPAGRETASVRLRSS